MTKIPNQLLKKDIGFVKLQHRSKKPFEKNWQNKPYSSKEIQQWIASGQNYGVLGGTGKGNLIITDSDHEKLTTKIFQEFPPTFTVKTPKKGFHSYFFCQGIDKKIILAKNDIHYGEIISHGSQCVGPGSVHPETGTKYVVSNDTNIQTIDSKFLYDQLSDFFPLNLLKNHCLTDFQKLTQKYGDPYYFNEKNKISSINQSFFAGLYFKENIIIFEKDEKEFYQYDHKTGLYVDITQDHIKKCISERILEISKEQNIKSIEQKRTNILLNNIVSQLRGISEKRDVFKNKQKIIHLENGVIDLTKQKSFDLVEFSPFFFSRNKSPIPFDETARCDRFLNDFLLPALPQDDILLLQKYTGLCLLGTNLIQKFLILDGKSGRGKSTFTEIIQKLIGQENISELRAHNLSERFELYRFRKKTCLIGIDVPGDFLSKKGSYLIKGLVGGDLFDAEKKGHSGNFLVKGDFCMIITSNSKLQIRLDGDVDAWKRRLLIIDFNAEKPSKKIPNFADIIFKEESSGVLNWGLMGISMLFEDIKKNGDIEISQEQKKRIKRLLSESDSIKYFLKDRVQKNPNYSLATDEIITSYSEYCSEKGWKPKPITIAHTEIPNLMLELFQTHKSHSIKYNGKNVRGYHNVGFKEELLSCEGY